MKHSTTGYPFIDSIEWEGMRGNHWRHESEVIDPALVQLLDRHMATEPPGTTGWVHYDSTTGLVTNYSKSSGKWTVERIYRPA